MLQIIWAVIGGLIGLFSRENKPYQIAFAIALGTMLGLIPKDNLVALVLVLLLFLLHANLGIGILAAAVVTFGAPQLDPYADRLGTQLLGLESIQKLEADLFQYPLFAWSSLNNTVILGQFVFGLLAFVPIFLVVFFLCRLFVPRKKIVTQNQKNEKPAFKPVQNG